VQIDRKDETDDVVLSARGRGNHRFRLSRADSFGDAPCGIQRIARGGK
jgi:hypothetical protein